MTPPTVQPHHRIVVALDLSEYSEVVLEHALDQAAQHEASDLHFVTVVDERVDLDDIKRRLAALVLEGLDGFDCSNWRARLHVRTGEAVEEITDLAAEIRAHLIVVGRFGLHHVGKKRLGGVAARVVEAATCPTLVIGLADQSPDAQAQCPDCVRLRAETDGERWFCTAHSSPERFATTFLSGSSWGGGNLMW